jgi:hypothetical protein
MKQQTAMSCFLNSKNGSKSLFTNSEKREQRGMKFFQI